MSHGLTLRLVAMAIALLSAVPTSAQERLFVEWSDHPKGRTGLPVFNRTLTCLPGTGPLKCEMLVATIGTIGAACPFFVRPEVFSTAEGGLRVTRRGDFLSIEIEEDLTITRLAVTLKKAGPSVILAASVGGMRMPKAAGADKSSVIDIVGYPDKGGFYLDIPINCSRMTVMGSGEPK